MVTVEKSITISGEDIKVLFHVMRFANLYINALNKGDVVSNFPDHDSADARKAVRDLTCEIERKIESA